MQPVGRYRSIAHNIEAQVAFGGFDIAVGFTRRRPEELRNISADGAFIRHLLQRLLDDAQALRHLLHAHPVAVIAVAGLPGRYFKIKPVVD